MASVLILDTGGTFNKTYRPVEGTLEVDTRGFALSDIAKRWMCDLDVVGIIGKDSLHINSQDRLEMMLHISQTPHQHIIVVHGTDTMDVTARYLAESELQKTIVLTGAMVPYRIDPVEATANFAAAYGFLQADPDKGVYISMHGTVASHEKIRKDVRQGRFVVV